MNLSLEKYLFISCLLLVSQTLVSVGSNTCVCQLKHLCLSTQMQVSVSAAIIGWKTGILFYGENPLKGLSARGFFIVICLLP